MFGFEWSVKWYLSHYVPTLMHKTKWHTKSPIVTDSKKIVRVENIKFFAMSSLLRIHIICLSRAICAWKMKLTSLLYTLRFFLATTAATKSRKKSFPFHFHDFFSTFFFHLKSLVQTKSGLKNSGYKVVMMANIISWA